MARTPQKIRKVVMKPRITGRQVKQSENRNGHGKITGKGTHPYRP